MIVSFVSSKGGVGKTTATCAFAGEIAWQLRGQDAGRSVGLIDIDKNQHTKAWVQHANAPANLNYYDTNEDNIIEKIQLAKQENAFVFIDTAGEAKDETQQIVSQSDLVLIMSQASILDTKESIKTVKMVRRTETMCNRSVKHALLLTNTDPAISTKLGQEITRTVGAAGVHIFSTSLIRRQCFKQIFSEGGSFRSLYDAKERTKQQRDSIEKGINNLLSVLDEMADYIRGVPAEEPSFIDQYKPDELKEVAHA